MSESKFRPKPQTYKGVLFDGTNSPEIADWVRGKGGEARAGGSYVKVRTEYIIDERDGEVISDVHETAKKGDWIICYDSGIFSIVPDDIIDQLFVRVK